MYVIIAKEYGYSLSVYVMYMLNIIYSNRHCCYKKVLINEFDYKALQYYQTYILVKLNTQSQHWLLAD